MSPESPDAAPLMTIAVMTYNRPDHLRNCLESVARHAPGARLVVIDDSSTDPRQQAELQWAEATLGARIITGTGTQGWHGGLYHNMQRALDGCETPLLMYLQDDTQLVRAISDGDLAEIVEHFHQTGAVFAYPFFVKGRKRRAWAPLFALAPGARFLRPRPRKGRGAQWFSYADICVADVAALRAAGWTFAQTEKANSEVAARLFPQGMSLITCPWGFYCPEVPVFRNRKPTDSLVLRLAGPPGDIVKAFNDLDRETIARLVGRTSPGLPVAEEWLTTLDPRVKRPFVYQDTKRNLLLWVLFGIEMRLRRKR